MSKVKIYQFEGYDVNNDQMKKSRRLGTREAIEIIHCHVLEETATDVDESAVKSDIPGLTARDFIPHPREGFQRSVSS